MTPKKKTAEAPYGFRWFKTPSGMNMLTADMRTKKGKELLRKAKEIMSRPETSLGSVVAELNSLDPNAKS